ncbi:alpha/beta fold hydrolase [Streptomyces sp. HF10]|uniref:alpha/beta fold hydrolase n=1 Tax=Streptomyces sp. HF10 TaxID=2692233 RepID=UPI0013188FED|nr:alpha/beta hydrolase [Streptomyces sp. HF10]QHC27698.1 alpha/beta fold hydrolase [Streptomyces sp. HF10]
MTSPVSTGNTRTVDLPGGLSVTVEERGSSSGGRGFLLLHGGAGPWTMVGLAEALAEHAYTVVPTHPGFQGTPRPERVDSPADLAVAYLDLLDVLGLDEVMVIGSSVGGWIASEMALRDTKGRIGSLTLLNAVGVDAAQKEDAVVDVRTLTPAELAQLSFADPAFRPDFSSFSDEQRAQGAANQRTLAVYGGAEFSYDPKLRGRLHRVGVPVLVVWGERDGIASTAYGRGYATSFSNGRFTPIPEAGHFPHIEQLGRTLAAIGDFADTVVNSPSAA